MEKRNRLIEASTFILIGMLILSIFSVDFPPAPSQAEAGLPKTVSYDQELEIKKFNIIPQTLQAGETAELLWNVSGAAQVFIDNKRDLNRAEVSPIGRMTITPLETTHYILTAYDRQMLAMSAVATIDVHGQPPAPQATLKADPTNIIAGDTVTLTWKTLFANTVSIDNGIGKVGLSGMIVVTPETTTTYTLAATGLGGSNIANITINVLNSQASSHFGGDLGGGKK